MCYTSMAHSYSRIYNSHTPRMLFMCWLPCLGWTLRCEPVISYSNHGNSIHTDQDSWHQGSASKSVETDMHARTHTHAQTIYCFRGETKSAICAHRPPRTKYFIDNKHWRDWCEAESVREEGRRRKRERQEDKGRRGRGIEKDRYTVDTGQQNKSGFSSWCCYNNRGLEVNACLKWDHFLILHIRTQPCS